MMRFLLFVTGRVKPGARRSRAQRLARLSRQTHSTDLHICSKLSIRLMHGIAVPSDSPPMWRVRC